MSDNGLDPIEIREAGREDLEQVLSLYTQLGMDDGRTLTLEEAAALLEGFRKYPDYRLYVATSGESTVGAFSLLIMQNLAHCGARAGIVEDVVVRESWRGLGVGREMMTFARDRCREKGCYKMVLSSNLARTDAARFYERLGFRRHGYSFLVNLRES